MAYCTVTDVELFRGADFEGDQDVVAASLVEAASDYVDHYTHRSWKTVTVTGEVVRAYGGIVHLADYPITGVVSVTARRPYVGATVETLVAGSTYDVLDLTLGILAVSAWDGTYVTVSYTTAPTLPADIKQAVVMLASYWLGGMSTDPSQVYSKIKAGSVELTYRDIDRPLPPSVAAILDLYRPKLAFA